MDVLRKLNYVLSYLLAIGVGSSFLASIALAAVKDSRFELSAEGASVDLNPREVTRCDVLDRRFAGRGIKREAVYTAPVRSEIARPTFAITKSAEVAAGQAPAFRNAPSQPPGPMPLASPSQQSIPGSAITPSNPMAPGRTDAASRSVSPVPNPTEGALLSIPDAKQRLLPVPGASIILPVPSRGSGHPP